MAYKFLESKNAETGGLQLSNNSKYFHGNFLRNKEYFDYDSSILRGNLYESFWLGNVGAMSTLFFHITIPAGKLLKSISYTQKILGGPFLFDLILGGTVGPVVETLPGYNADRRRFSTANQFTSASATQRLSSFDETNSVTIDEWYGVSENKGTDVQSLSLSALGAGGLYDNNSQPTFKIFNESNSAARIAFSWVWIEFDASDVLFLPI